MQFLCSRLNRNLSFLTNKLNVFCSSRIAPDLAKLAGLERESKSDSKLQFFRATKLALRRERSILISATPPLAEAAARGRGKARG
jgi:hypothetical protein